MRRRDAPGRISNSELPSEAPIADSMAISNDEFWALCVSSGLWSLERCEALKSEYSRLERQGHEATAASLSEWLIARDALSRYQALVLLSGRPGPFVFGEFVIHERIEEGRLARAFRASFKRTRPVLVIFAAASRDSPRQARITIEKFEAARAVKSPHVLRVYQYQGTAAPPFFVLEDLHGNSLREWSAGRAPTVDEACRFGCQAARGLLAIHESRSVHGNLTPDNIWVDPAANIKLLQFPLTGPVPPNERFQPETVDYLAPELADESQPSSALSDIYSLGCTLYELIAGRVPFPGGSVRQKIERHGRETPERLDRLVAGVPGHLADLVEQMLHKEPAMRAQAASQAAQMSAPRSSTAGQPQMRDHGDPREANRQTSQQRRPPDVARRAAEQSATPATPESNAPPIVVDTTRHGPGDLSIGAPRAQRRRQRTTAIAVAAGLLVVSTITIAAIVASQSGDRDQSRGPVAKESDGTRRAPVDAATPRKVEPGSQGATDGRAASDGTAGSNIIEIDDDGRSLWVSPTSGAALNLRYSPSSTQLVLVLRPAEILAGEEGARLFEALGDAGQAAQDHLRSILGVELTDIEQLTVAFAPDETGTPQAAYVMRLARAIPEAALLEAWEQPQAAVHNAKTYFAGARWAYYLPAEGQGRVVAVAAPSIIKEILQRDGDPLLRNSIEDLLHASDADRHFNLLAAPSYLLTDGRALLPPDLAKLRAPLERLFDLTVQAVLVSGHVDEELFLEMRVVSAARARPDETADNLRAQLATCSQELERYVASLAPHPYGRMVVFRFPRMVQLATSFTRSAVEGRQVVLRCYLPAHAAHNLLLGAQLALGEEPAPGAPPSGAPAAARSGAAAALDRVVSLSFPRDTLERSLELLAQEIHAQIVILGSDLETEGITKNQSFGLDERDKPAREILAKVLALANPDGKLVYVIKPGEPGNEAIYITTRAAAARRNDPLPDGQDQKTTSKSP